jgi:hypothetical protein
MELKMIIKRLQNHLQQPVDNTSLVLFRIAFGFLIAVESFGAILTGWVRKAFIEPEFTFSFIGFEWLQPLHGNGMYLYYGLMGVLGLMVMLGVFYRYSLGLFTLLWWGTYLMQKTNYNNHYYLLILLCLLMLLVPADRNASIDSSMGSRKLAINCPRWCVEIIKWQLLIVFTYAGLAKLYPGWLQGEFISIIFSTKAHWPMIGEFLQLHLIHMLVVYGGIVYDLAIIPLMYGPKTRKFGLIASVGFHLFNSVILGIGIFPYMMLASLLLFFPTASWQPHIPGYISEVTQYKSYTHPALGSFLVVYFTLQLWLPVRHNFIQGDVFKTEEGHRMAWRMMLRSKTGTVHFNLVDKKTGTSWKVFPSEYLTGKQSYKIGGHPDMIWQFSGYLAKVYAKQGIVDLEIYTNANASLNGSTSKTLIDPKVDLLSVDWKRFGHNSWIVID